MEEVGTGPVRAGLIRRAMPDESPAPRMRDVQRGRAKLLTADEERGTAVQEAAMREANLAEIGRELRRRDLGERQRATLEAERDRIAATAAVSVEGYGEPRFRPE